MNSIPLKNRHCWSGRNNPFSKVRSEAVSNYHLYETVMFSIFRAKSDWTQSIRSWTTTVMLCEIGEQYGFVALWAALSALGAISVFSFVIISNAALIGISFPLSQLLQVIVLSGLVFVPYYARPSYEKWVYKSNPKFPTPKLGNSPRHMWTVSRCFSLLSLHVSSQGDRTVPQRCSCGCTLPRYGHLPLLCLARPSCGSAYSVARLLQWPTRRWMAGVVICYVSSRSVCCSVMPCGVF